MWPHAGPTDPVLAPVIALLLFAVHSRLQSLCRGGGRLVLSFGSCVVEQRYSFFDTKIKCKGNPGKGGSTVQAELISLPTLLLFVQPPSSVTVFPSFFGFGSLLRSLRAGCFCLSLSGNTCQLPTTSSFTSPTSRMRPCRPCHWPNHSNSLRSASVLRSPASTPSPTMTRPPRQCATPSLLSIFMERANV